MEAKIQKLSKSGDLPTISRVALDIFPNHHSTGHVLANSLAAQIFQKRRDKAPFSSTVVTLTSHLPVMYLPSQSHTIDTWALWGGYCANQTTWGHLSRSLGDMLSFNMQKSLSFTWTFEFPPISSLGTRECIRSHTERMWTLHSHIFLC